MRILSWNVFRGLDGKVWVAHDAIHTLLTRVIVVCRLHFIAFANSSPPLLVWFNKLWGQLLFLLFRKLNSSECWWWPVVTLRAATEQLVCQHCWTSLIPNPLCSKIRKLFSVPTGHQVTKFYHSWTWWSSWKAEAGETLRVWGHPGPHSKFQARQCYIVGRTLSQKKKKIILHHETLLCAKLFKIFYKIKAGEMCQWIRQLLCKPDSPSSV